MSESGRTAAGAAALFVLAALYFTAGSTQTLELVDEGHLVYESLRVAQGAIPYRDFQHIYGPSVFLLNGALLWLFGADLLVIRLSLVVLRAATVVLVYLLARRMAAPRYALLATALLAAVWGAPWWVFNTPYANHYSVFLTLLGLQGFLALRSRFALACLVAGLAFGVAATFKQTAGAFALAGFAVFLILDDQEHGGRAMPAAALPAAVVRGGRLTALAGIAALCVAYLARRNTAWNVLVLLTPALATIALAAARELRLPVGAAERAGLAGILIAGVGTAAPLLLVAAYYAAHGWLGELLFGLVGLPRQVEWFEAYLAPGAGAMCGLAFVAALAAAVVAARRRLPTAADRSRRAWTTLAFLPALLLLGAAAALLVPGVLAFLRMRLWQYAALYSWFVVPPAALWLTALLLLRGWARSVATATIAPQRSTVLLVYCNAVMALLLLYPAADFMHVVMALPPFVPLMAWLAERLQRFGAQTPVTAPSRLGSALLIGALAIWLGTAPVDQLVRGWLQSRTDTTVLARATAIHGQKPHVDEVASLLAYLDTQAPPQRELLALNSEQMFYFLSGRRSPLEHDEFVFYLLRNRAISDQNAHRLFDEQAAIARLTERQPLVIVESGEGTGDTEVRRVFADLSRHLDSHYETAYSVGPYRVLIWTK